MWVWEEESRVFSCRVGSVIWWVRYLVGATRSNLDSVDTCNSHASQASIRLVLNKSGVRIYKNVSASSAADSRKHGPPTRKKENGTLSPTSRDRVVTPANLYRQSMYYLYSSAMVPGPRPYLHRMAGSERDHAGMAAEWNFQSLCVPHHVTGRNTGRQAPSRLFHTFSARPPRTPSRIFYETGPSCKHGGKLVFTLGMLWASRSTASRPSAPARPHNEGRLVTRVTLGADHPLSFRGRRFGLLRHLLESPGSIEGEVHRRNPELGSSSMFWSPFSLSLKTTGGERLGGWG